jgi:hypothetical protein
MEDDLVAGRKAPVQGDGQEEADSTAGDGDFEEAQPLEVEGTDGGAAVEW